MNTKLARLLLAILLSTTALARVGASSRYVNEKSTTPSPPYTNWGIAARAIQEAIDVAVAGDEVVVTNGIYNFGSRAVNGGATNRVAVTKLVAVRSVNGPEVTVIQGHAGVGTFAIRCVYLTN